MKYFSRAARHACVNNVRHARAMEIPVTSITSQNPFVFNSLSLENNYAAIKNHEEARLGYLVFEAATQLSFKPPEPAEVAKQSPCWQDNVCTYSRRQGAGERRCALRHLTGRCAGTGHSWCSTRLSAVVTVGV